MLIDTDVHETPPGFPAQALVPYVDPHWQRFLKREGGLWMGEPEPATSAAPVASGREDWRDDGGPAGRTVESLRHHLLDGEGVTTAILNGPELHPAPCRATSSSPRRSRRRTTTGRSSSWLEKDDRLSRLGARSSHDLPEVAAREIDRVAEHPQIVQVFLPLDHRTPVRRSVLPADLRGRGAQRPRGRVPPRVRRRRPSSAIRATTSSGTRSPRRGCAQNQLISLMFNGVFDQSRELKVVLLESGVAWVPWFMGRADQQYRELRANGPVGQAAARASTSATACASSTQPMTEVTAKRVRQLVEMARPRAHVRLRHRLSRTTTPTPQSRPERGVRTSCEQRIRWQNAIETYPKLAGLAPGRMKHRVCRLDEIDRAASPVSRSTAWQSLLRDAGRRRARAARPLRARGGEAFARPPAAEGQRGQGRRVCPLARTSYVVRCPWHGYEFDVETGHSIADPRRARVRAYAVTIADGVVFIER